MPTETINIPDLDMQHMTDLAQPVDGLTPQEMDRAEEITVQKPGSNMLWVEIVWGTGEIDKFSVKSTPQNDLLYNRDKYQFQGKSLYTILFGDEHTRVIISEDPYVAVKPGPYRDTYRLWVENELESVLTSPDQSRVVLTGVVELTEEQDATKLARIYENIRENQINREAVLALLNNGYIPESDRIEEKADGLVVDEMLLLTWENEFHLYTETWSDGAFTPNGNAKEKPGEFREITIKEVHGDRSIEIDGITYQMTSDEHIFMRRLEWILNWERHLDDGEIECMKRTVPIIQEHNL